MQLKAKGQYVLRHLSSLMLLSFGIWSNALFAQDTLSRSDTANQATFKNSLAITPLKLWAFSNVGPELIYQRMLSERTSVQVKASYIYAYMVPPFFSSAQEAQGGRIGTEFKWFHSGNTNKGGYVGFELEGGQISRSSTYTTDFGQYSETYLYDIHIAYASANIKIGYQVMFKRFFLDLFWGLGPRLIHVDYTGVTDREYGNIYEEINDDWATMITPNPLRGRYLNVSMPLNLRVGLAF